ncbi:MAG: DNA-protecting protein DprA [Ignavibacteria bacterium]|nr:DNA-protecting protein DprA [Ignavibacteria bacterium]
MHNVRDLLRLSSVPRIGAHKLRALVGHFGSPTNVLAAKARDLICVEGIHRRLATAIAHHDGSAFADDQLRRMNRSGARIVTIWDKEYPELLKRIYDPPAFLYVRGTLGKDDRNAIALVGTRHPSPYGMRIAESLSRDLAELGVVVVSGLARGIDTIVHAAVIRSQGRTIAVIGSGVDIVYPPENRSLFHQIIETGAVVSEFPMGAKPDAPNFPKRNRIISGMSLGSVVIESAEDGGAMITASTALDQNREVFAVPGPIGEKKSAGPNVLIRDGRAKLITGVPDIIAELGSHLKLETALLPSVQRTIALTLFEETILSCLSTEPLHIDAIADQCQTTTSDALVTLLSLEFKGLVRQLPGKYFQTT